MRNLRRALIASAAIATCAVAALTAPAAAGRGTPPWLRVTAAEDTGTGETLVVLVAGSYPTRAPAERAAARMTLGDMQGFVVARSDDFTAMPPGSWLLVTAFRTNEGADQLLDVARAARISLRRVVTRYTGHYWIGLGQEANPDGSGPLVQPLPYPTELR